MYKRQTLEYKKAKISTVEHCLAALVGMQVDNALIKINGSELPILDGSSKPFTDAISKIGVVEQDEKRTFIEITEEISYFDSNNGVRFKILPSDKFELEVKIDYNSKVLGVQNAYLENIQDFQSTIAASRTFCFLHELNNLYENNLIKGGNLNNAVVFVDREIKDEEAYMLEKVLNKSEIEINDHGFLSNTDLRFENEPARHKLLDIIGDLALLGKPIKGKVIAFKPGHAANVAFAKLINKKIYSNII